MAILRYEISAEFNRGRMRRVLRGVEQEAVAAGKRFDRAFARGASSQGGPYRTSGRAGARTGVDNEFRKHLKGWQDIGKVAYTLERRRHMEAMRNIERERQARVRAARAVARGVGTGVSRAGGAVRNVVGMGAGVLGLGAGMMVGGAVRRRIEEGTLASGISARAAVVPGERRSRDQLLKLTEDRARALETRTGRSAGTFLEGMDKFLEKTGMFDEMLGLSGFIADFSDSMGLADENFKQLGQTAGIVAAGLKSTNPEMTQKELIEKTKEAITAMGAQSAAGQIGIPELAVEMPKILAAAGRQEGDPAKNLAFMTAMANVATAVAAKDPAESATAVVNLTTDLIKKQGMIKSKFGVDVMNEQGGLREIEQILPALMAATGGDLTKVTTLANIRGMKALEAPAAAVRGAGLDLKTKEGRAQAEQIVKQMFAPFMAATMDQGEIQKGAGFTRQTDARRIAMQFQDMERAIADDFVPILIQDLLPALKELAPHAKDVSKAFAKFIRWFAQDPLAGLGVILAAAAAKEIAAAGLGAIVGKALDRAIGGGSGGKGLGGKAGAALGGLGLGAAVGLTIYATGVTMFNQSEADIKTAGRKVLQAEQSEDVGVVAGILSELKERRRALGEEEQRGKGVIGGVVNFVTGRDETLKTETATQDAMIARVEKRLVELSTKGDDSAKKNSEAANKMSQAGDKMSKAADVMASGAGRRTDPASKR